MMNNSKSILRHALTQILPSTGLITQAGAQWKLVRTVPGLESFTTRQFSSREEVINAIADYYVEQAPSNVSDLNRSEDDVNVTKKAV